MTLDLRVRAAAFAFLEEQTTLHGEVLPYEVLAKGFEFDGVRVPLISRQGIFKPKVLPDMPLTIKTVAPKDGRPPPTMTGFAPTASSTTATAARTRTTPRTSDSGAPCTARRR